MAGRGYENGKYFEINSRGKLKEFSPPDALTAHKIAAQKHMAKKTSQDFIERALKEHEHPYWKKD